MTLECANGKTYEHLNAQILTEVLESLNNADNDFAILQSSDGFLQTAVNGSGFIIEYRDRYGYFRSEDEGIPLGRVKEAFQTYLKGDPGWKASLSWVPADAGPTEQEPASRTGGRFEKPENLVDDLVDTVKQNLKSAAKKKLGKFLKF